MRESEIQEPPIVHDQPYQVVTAFTIGDLMREVNKKWNEGYRPIGTIVVEVYGTDETEDPAKRRVYHQALTPRLEPR